MTFPLLDSYNAKSISYDGKMYTEYEASQIQRKMERTIRKWKRENAALSAAGQDASESAAKIKQWQEMLRDFTKQTGLKMQSAREQIANPKEIVIERIGISLGAKAKNYNIYNPATGEFVNLAEGSRITQPKNHVMAGAGRDRKIDNIDFLLDKYGGSELLWTKEKGFGYVLDEYGEERKVELHWYQEPSVPGKPEIKIKVQPDGRIYLDD